MKGIVEFIKNPGLGFKIGSGYATILVFAMVLGGMALWSMNEAGGLSMKLNAEFAPQVGVANNVERYSLDTLYHMRGYALSLDKQYLEAGRRSLQEVRKYLDEAKRLAAGSPDLARLRELLGPAEAKVDEFDQLLNETVDRNRSIDIARKEMDAAAGNFMESAMNYGTAQNQQFKNEIQSQTDSANLLERQSRIKLIGDITVYGYWIRTGSFKFQALRDTAFIEKALQNFKELDKMLEKLKSENALEQDRKDVEKLVALKGEYRKAVESLHANWNSLQEVSKKREIAGDQLLKMAIEMAQVGMEHVNQIAATTSSSLSSASIIMSTGQGVVLVLGICLAVLIVRSITKPIRVVMQGLAESADRVAGASEQVSDSSLELADGASEQAASIEETSSSLEEMSSMTKQNANNAIQANNLMRTTKETVLRASRSMEKLTGSMSEISKASESTSRVVKTIDEIAFQTNLLALNAAVEAARAGEAGAGFAVVADEVRSLSRRTANEAKTTSDLIVGTVEKIREGSALLGITENEFHELAGAVQKSAELVGEIAVASNEQAQGIEQVTKAVGDMDNVVQRNAVHAEESASASNEMNAQASQMKEYVIALKSLVEGNRSFRKTRKEGTENRREGRREPENPLPQHGEGRDGGKKVRPESVERSGKLIPFDGEESSNSPVR
jgi:methyl-accepting chemotaxis protein